MTYLKYYFTCIQKLINRFAHIRNIAPFLKLPSYFVENQCFNEVTEKLPEVTLKFK